ncbi:MAG: TonB-dependent siderophore receptor [Methylococcales bacterium]
MANRHAGTTARFSGISGRIGILSFIMGLAWYQLVCADVERKALEFNIAGQSLAGALTQFAVQSDLTLSYRSKIAADLRSPGLRGTYSAEEALRRLLENTPIRYRFNAEDSVVLDTPETAKPKPKATPIPSGSTDDSVALGKVTVSAKTVTGGYDPSDPYNTEYAVPNATSATKTDTPIMETPLSIQVVPRAVMDDQQAIRISDALKNVSGVRVNNSVGLNIFDDFVIRGFAGDRGIYRNGLRSLRFANETANIARIDVLKGPASTLFGRTEPGGLVNIVTKEPLDQAYYAFNQQFGSFEHYRTTLEATGPVDKIRDILYRFDAAYQNNKSFKDFLHLERVFVAPAITWNLSDRTQVNLKYDYQADNLGNDGGIPAIGNRPAPVPRRRNIGEQGAFNRIISNLGELSWSHSFNDSWTLRNRFLTRHRDLRQRLITGVALLPDQHTLTRGLFDVLQDEASYATNLDLIGEFTTFNIKHNVLVGYDYYRRTQDAPGVSLRGTSLIPSLDLFNPVYGRVDFAALDNLNANFFFRSRQAWHGVYFQDQINILDKVYLLLGGRHDWAEQGSGFSTQSLADAKVQTVRAQKFKPRFGLVYQPWQWLSLYANYVESLGSNNGRSATGAPFQPQEGEQAEAGFKTEFYDGRLSTTLAFFTIKKQNLLTADLSTPDPFDRRAIGEARSRGIEFDISGQLTDNLRVIGSYAFLDTKITKDASGNQGNRLGLAPEHSGNLWATYQFNEGPLRGLSFGSGAFLSSDRPGNNENNFTLPGYARWDASIAYAKKVAETQITARLNVENILNKFYYQGTNLSDGSPRTSIFAGAPTTVFGSINIQF